MIRQKTTADHNKVERVDCGAVVEYVADVTNLTKMHHHHYTIYQRNVAKC